MESLEKTETVCRSFEDAAIKHAEATETGDLHEQIKTIG